MNFAKAFIQKIALWLRSEAKTVEQTVIEKAQAEVGTLKTVVEGGRTYVAGIGVGIADDLDTWLATKGSSFSLTDPSFEAVMSTPAAATPATTGNNVNTAVQIALALKAIDAALSVEAVQAATNAALAAAYPAAAA